MVALNRARGEEEREGMVAVGLTSGVETKRRVGERFRARIHPGDEDFVALGRGCVRVCVCVCVCMCVYACVRVHVWLKSNCNSQGWVDRGGSQPKGDVSLPCFLFR